MREPRPLPKKPLEDLVKICQAGLTRLHVGLETGDRELLKEIEKGSDSGRDDRSWEKSQRGGI